MNEKYDNFPWCLERETFRIFEPEYKTKILRWFAQEDVPRQQKEDFIEALIDFEDGCGGFYSYRAYFLAAEALAHFPDCHRGDEIIRQLLCWSYAYFQEKPDWEKFPIPLVRAAQNALE
ncbi:hypothetical protein [Lusitaniella coriacea]|uniref:hypothetical protein n=1 Tax=Lusitaniella coriacea TaxID=1983105 RepID=UPI003CF762DB